MEWVGLLGTVATGAAAAWVGYGFGVRQDKEKWNREQRAALYVDLLVEGYAEQQWVLGELAHVEMVLIDEEETDPRSSERTAEWVATRDRLLPDLRLPPMDRARLGARMAAYGSPAVTKAFNAIGRQLAPFSTDHPQIRRIRTQEAFDRLEAQIRRELGSLEKE